MGRAPSSSSKGNLLMRSLVPTLASLVIAQLPLLTPFSAAADKPVPFETRVIMSGHSLTDPIPSKLIAMVESMTGWRRFPIYSSTLPGSPLEYRWKHRAGENDARHSIDNFEILVTTERAPLSNTVKWHNTETSALQWLNHAWTNGNHGKGAQMIFYATWVGLDSGLKPEPRSSDTDIHIRWRERLPRELAEWERITDHVNAGRPKEAPAMRLIPGTLIMATIHDAIQRGEVPGIRSHEELFSDTIHLNDAGAYLIALAHYAVIYRRDPRELPDNVSFVARPETAAYMQQLVWDIVSNYPRAGLTAKR